MMFSIPYTEHCSICGEEMTRASCLNENGEEMGLAWVEEGKWDPRRDQKKPGFRSNRKRGGKGKWTVILTE